MSETRYRAKNLDTNELGPIRDSATEAVLDTITLDWPNSTFVPVDAGEVVA